MRAEDDAGAVVILTALNLEYAAVRAHLVDTRKHHHHTGTVFDEALLPGGAGRVILGVTGDGPQPAAVLTDRAMAMFPARAVLFVGIAGALHDDLSVGDIVVATRIYGYHGGLDGETFQNRPRAFEAPHGLLQLARHLDADGQWHGYLPEARRDTPPPVRFRPVASGEVVLNSRTTHLAGRLRDSFNDAAAIETEGVGAAYAGHLNAAAPVIIVRGISDLADGNKFVTDRVGSQELAAANAAAFAIGLATQIMRRPAPPHGAPARAGGTVQVPPTAGTIVPAKVNGSHYRGRTKLEFVRRLSGSWTELADLLEIPPHEQRRFTAGEEARGIWEWLAVRDRLRDLSPAVRELGRADLVELLDLDLGN